MTEGETHGSPQLDHLTDGVEVFADLDAPIWVFDRGYTRYSRFCEIKYSEKDFVTLLRTDGRVEVFEQLQDFGITDKTGTRHVRDERIELAETGEEFRRIVLETADGEEIEYLTILSPAAYDPIDVVSIYTLRTFIEILFREPKQYANIENFHLQSLNGMLFELFCALIGYLLVEWFRQRHPMRDGVPEAIKNIWTHWNDPVGACG